MSSENSPTNADDTPLNPQPQQENSNSNNNEDTSQHSNVPNDEATTRPPVSKKQLKKLAKHERWIASKAERKQREKEKRKAKLAKLKEAGEEIVSRKQVRHQLVKQSDSPCKVMVVIDCDYADFMNELELKKLCKQLNRCYSLNKHSVKPVQLHITSVSGLVKDALTKYQHGYQNWDAQCTEKHWTEMFSGEDDDLKLNPRIVYLTGDSSDIVDDCQSIQEANNAIFIIGGLIDHNRYKGLALERAQKFAVKHGQLPIGEHIRMCQRRILSIPHVFEIMLFAANGTIGTSWNDIFQKVIPSRKLAD